MFDATTAALLRSAPAVPGLNPANIPALLTREFANLAAARLREAPDSSDEPTRNWSLDRLADTYQIMTSLATNPDVRRPAAFVAGTAQQIIARRQALTPEERRPNIDRDRVDPSIAAAVLFLSAEQYADAIEASHSIATRLEGQTYEAEILAEDIVDLAQGRLYGILERGARWRRRRDYSSLEERALAALLETLVTGVELLSASILHENAPEPAAGRFDNAQGAFQAVIELAAQSIETFLPESELIAIMGYPGPHHLATLLLSASEGLASASLLATLPPQGANKEVWTKWLRSRAKSAPYVWPNHREAIAKGFYQTGVSAVVVLPTGAGKTTVSSLKIGGVLARGKKVVFLAPTHALVDQLTTDLQEMFPPNVMGSTISSDFDLLLLEAAQFQDVEVMTPERCLAMLSFAPESFAEVGLLVFDECHLLSPEGGKIRRALDSMLCVLGFNHVVPDADLLFLSAMLKNAEEMSEWCASLTGRPSVAVDLPWKPSRQARGVVIYDENELAQIRQAASGAQKNENARTKKVATAVRTVAKKLLRAQPFAIWGLQHNWLSEKSAFCTTTPIANGPVELTGALRHISNVRLTPNANVVATCAAGNPRGRQANRRRRPRRPQSA